MKRGVILLMLALASAGGRGQDASVLDSLHRLLRNQLPDTQRIDVLNELALQFRRSNIDSTKYYTKQALLFAISNSYNKGKANALVSVGFLYHTIGNQKLAKDYIAQSLELFLQLGDKEGEAICYSWMGMFFEEDSQPDSAIACYTKALGLRKTLGKVEGVIHNMNQVAMIYESQGNVQKATTIYMKAIALAEKNNDKYGMAETYNNLAYLMTLQGQYSQAVEYFQKTLSIDEETGNNAGMGNTLNNIGFIYFKKGDTKNALSTFFKSLELKKKTGDKREIAGAMDNIGAVYRAMNDNENALKYHAASLSVFRELDDKQGIALSLNNLAPIYAELYGEEKGLDAYKEALENAQSAGDLNVISQLTKNLARSYGWVNDYKTAFLHMEKYSKLRDSLINENNANQIAELNAKYQNERKELEIKNLEQEQSLQKAETEKQRSQKIIFGGGLVVAILLGALLLIGFFNKRKANKIISQQKQEVEHQKELVEEKNAEILDSIAYAKRLQEAILPPDRIVKEYLQESFILHKPKDIVAGDFYWMENVSREIGDLRFETKNTGDVSHLSSQVSNLILFAAADCTGHGVPGAMVSVVCHNALNRAVREFKLTEPGKILDKVRELVIETFEKSDHEVKDGMDIALCSLEFTVSGFKLSYAGANNPLWVYRKGAHDIEQLEEIKADKQPIGKYTEARPFTTHRIGLQKGDSFYIFTDGFADQFGGPKGKKYKYKPFKELLLSLQNKAMAEQRMAINTAFEEWRGELQQVDDVCVIGVKL